jgi:hypothetical protein
MDHVPVSYISHTIVLMLEKGLAFLLPCTTQMLDIHSYDVLMFYIWYTKQILFCPYLCSSLAGMLSSSDPPSTPLWLDLSFDIGSLQVVGLSIEPLPVSKTYVVAMHISSVVVVN